MLQRPHFLPKESPSSVAQTAHCVRIILCMVKSLGGSQSASVPLGVLASCKALASWQPETEAKNRLSRVTGVLLDRRVAPQLHWSRSSHLRKGQ